MAKRVAAACDLAWLRREKAGRKIVVSCLRLGPAYVVNMPGELSVLYQLAAEKMRPRNFVCMAAYEDYGPGYVCMRVHYAQGGYEPSASRVGSGVESVLMGAMKKVLE